MNTAGTQLPAESDPRPLLVIVDDEQPILASLRSLFRRSPYEVQLFSSGQDALTFLSLRTPEIIISDMRMPGMTGLVFLEQASKLSPSSARLMLSGYEDKNIILDAISQDLAQQYIMKPWEDKELLRIVEDALRVRTGLHKQRLDELLHRITMFPSPPQTQAQLKRVVGHKDRSIKELAAEVEKDPGLVARIFRVSNSVYFAARTQITSVQDAVSFIGIEYVESLILALGVFNQLGNGADKEYAKQLEDLWHHALYRAILGRTIAEQWPGFREPNMAYVVCLLLDIGFIIRLHTDPEKYKELVQSSKLRQLPLHQVERSVFDIGHAEVGAALLQYWNFPSAIVSAVGQHHGLAGDDTLAQIAQIADIVESGDRSQPHDPALEPLIEKWSSQLSSCNFTEDQQR